MAECVLEGWECGPLWPRTASSSMSYYKTGILQLDWWRSSGGVGDKVVQF